MRALAAHEHRTAAGLIALLVLAYLWPVLLGGAVLTPAPMLYKLAPWTTLAPADFTHYVNMSLADVPLSYYPWDVLARRLIHAGTFPAWNPSALAGTPFFANPEVAWLSPYSLPLWLLPLDYGLGVAAALKLWMAGFGTYLLARELRLGFWPGVVAGLAFTLCAFSVVWLSAGVFLSVTSLLPWMLWLIERIVRRARSADALALAGIVAWAMTGGHPGAQVHTLTAAGIYALARVAWGMADAGAAAPRGRLRRLGLVGAALGLGVLVCAVVLLPAQQAAAGTAGAAARRGGGAEPFFGAHMPFGVLRTALFPDWWARPSEFEAGPGSYNERTFYTGAATLLLAVTALVSPGGWRAAWRRMAPFALLGALGLGVALDAPGLHAFVVHVPPFDQVQNQRMVLWFELGIAMLAAFGLQELLDAGAPGRRAWGVIAAGVVAAVAAIASVGLGGGALGPALHYVLHRAGTELPHPVALASVAWWLVFVAALAVVLALVRLRPRLGGGAGALVALVVALDLLHFAHGYQPMPPAATAIPPRTPTVAFLQRHARDGRMAGVEFTLANDWTTLYGLHDARGYDAPQPSLHFLRLWRLLNPGQLAHTGFLFESLDATGLHVLGLLGARWVVTGPGQPTHGLPVAYGDEQATVLENVLAMPRAIVARRVDVAADEPAERTAIAARGFDPRREVVVRGADFRGAVPAPRGSTGTARVAGDANARVAVRATLARRGLVVLDDAWERGWSVRVDGRPARSLRVDMVLRGVVVPAGRHELVWSYRVPGLAAGAALSALGLLGAAAWAGALLARRRRGRR
jgi:hypothetical protein